ncbi:hypothetical protein SKAU_G00029430 [Synaphobranchus kaupii]|uniref:Uncharacterized protein n=1 Tax=Synaphobranchus kaupii TaxID=118154 RepID=A0A9Q1GEN8_SYNKA|nr:hypothetical protein SKAU_G00029430 [Synaphobranchus kaupii]
MEDKQEGRRAADGGLRSRADLRVLSAPLNRRRWCGAQGVHLTVISERERGDVGAEDLDGIQHPGGRSPGEGCLRAQAAFSCVRSQGLATSSPRRGGMV